MDLNSYKVNNTRQFYFLQFWNQSQNLQNENVKLYEYQ